MPIPNLRHAMRGLCAVWILYSPASMMAPIETAFSDEQTEPVHGTGGVWDPSPIWARIVPSRILYWASSSRVKCSSPGVPGGNSPAE